jgi:hypothetical protein
MQNRQQQWSNEDEPPPALDRDTFAYRFGPLGRHEVIVYFEMCRTLIGQAFQRISQTPHIEVSDLTNFLYDHAHEWLEKGSLDDDQMPPGKIIDSERRRLPLIEDGSGHFDCDCPICRMQADGMLGLTFIGFDGHQLELDDEFAFSLWETRREWMAEQIAYDEYKDVGERHDDKADPVIDPAGPNSELDDEFSSVWEHSMVNSEAILAAESPLLLTTMAVAMRVAELVGDLKHVDAEQATIARLNTAFDDLRSAEGDAVLTDSATAELITVLEDIAIMQPQLTPKVADLQSELDQWRRSRDGSSGREDLDPES